jgi:hypothetical protein
MRKWLIAMLALTLSTSFGCFFKESVESSENPVQSEESFGDRESSEGESFVEEESADSSLEEGIEEEKAYYTVQFDSDGGSSVASATVKKGEKVEKPDDPQKSSRQGEYEFLGWYYGDVEWDFETVVTEDITLVAKWNLKEGYTNPFLPKD